MKKLKSTVCEVVVIAAVFLAWGYVGGMDNGAPLMPGTIKIAALLCVAGIAVGIGNYLERKNKT